MYLIHISNLLMKESTLEVTLRAWNELLNKISYFEDYFIVLTGNIFSYCKPNAREISAFNEILNSCRHIYFIQVRHRCDEDYCYTKDNVLLAMFHSHIADNEILEHKNLYLCSNCHPNNSFYDRSVLLQYHENSCIDNRFKLFIHNHSQYGETFGNNSHAGVFMSITDDTSEAFKAIVWNLDNITYETLNFYLVE